MNDKLFLDTNILVYSFGVQKEKLPGARRDVAQALVIRGGTISVQVLNEFVQICRRKAGLDWTRTLGFRDLILELCAPVVPLALETHESAVQLSQRYNFSLYDALIIAAALQAGCTTLFSEDLQHGQIVEGLRIVNPFLETAQS